MEKIDYRKLEAERFGRRLTLSRCRAGLTQRGLATMVGVPQSEVSLFEKGGRKPGDKIIKALAMKLDVDPDWLKHGDIPNVIIGDDDRKREMSITYFWDRKADTKNLIKHIDSLSETDREFLAAIAETLVQNSNKDAFDEEMEKEIAEFKEVKKSLKTKTTADVIDTVSVANLIGEMAEYFPEVYDQFVTGKITVTEADKMIQGIVFKKWPDIKEMIDKNCINDEAHALKNRKYAIKRVLPLVRRRLIAERVK